MTVGRFQLTIKTIQKKVVRNYVKIQKVAADVGGFIKFCTIILNFISSELSYIHFCSFFYNTFIIKDKPINEKIEGKVIKNPKKVNITNINQFQSVKQVMKFKHNSESNNLEMKEKNIKFEEQKKNKATPVEKFVNVLY